MSDPTTLKISPDVADRLTDVGGELEDADSVLEEILDKAERADRGVTAEGYWPRSEYY